MGVTTHRKSSYEEGSLDQYLRDISIYPLISRDEEVRLAQRIRVNDQEALDKLVRSNLRFVVSVAKKYQNQGVSLSDLINEGNLGLIRAAHKFDETKGIKFISYAVWWIRQAILQALAEQSRIVRVPLNRSSLLRRRNSCVVNDQATSFRSPHTMTGTVASRTRGGMLRPETSRRRFSERMNPSRVPSADSCVCAIDPVVMPSAWGTSRLRARSSNIAARRVGVAAIAA